MCVCVFGHLFVCNYICVSACVRGVLYKIGGKSYTSSDLQDAANATEEMSKVSQSLSGTFNT